MKKYAILFAAAGLVPGFLHAQTVPLYINYQGKVTGGTGVPLGATGVAPNFTAAPENRKIIFRIFDAQTGGNRLWSEQQTVTISLGEFSVLLGQGTPAVMDAVTETPHASTPTFESVFTTNGPGAIPPTGLNRYLEIVVDTDSNGTFTAGADLAIAPRQRITTSAYSFRSKVADTVSAGAVGPASFASGAVTNAAITDGAIAGVKITASSIDNTRILDGTIITGDLADNAVTTVKIADNQITGAKILDGQIGNADHADNSIAGAKILDGTIATADLANNAVTTLKIADGQVTAAKLATDVGTWSLNGANVYRAAGLVGIGTNVPANPLTIRTAYNQFGFEHTDGNIRLVSFVGPNINSTIIGGWLGTFSNHPLSFFTNNQGSSLSISSPAGNVGIWRVATTNPLEVGGEASKSTGGGWLTNSDRRIKQEIVTIGHAMEKLERVRLVDFRYTEQYRRDHPEIKDKRYMNVIAQEFAEVFPDHVKGSGEKLPDGSEILQVDTYPLTIYSAAAVQELNAKLETREAEITELKQRLVALEAKDKARDAKLAAIEELLLSPGKPAARTVSLKARK